MPLSRKVQLAVSAFVRHKHTDYDKLLKQVSWGEARAMVEPVTLRQLKLWRGEGSDTSEIENVLREIIVIDSDDDNSVDGTGDDNDDVESVEFIATNARVNDRYVDAEYSPNAADAHQRTYLAPQRRRGVAPYPQNRYSQRDLAPIGDNSYPYGYIDARQAEPRGPETGQTRYRVLDNDSGSYASHVPRHGVPESGYPSRHPLEDPRIPNEQARQIYAARDEAYVPRQAS